jgi:hypothetical protein
MEKPNKMTMDDLIPTRENGEESELDQSVMSEGPR